MADFRVRIANDDLVFSAAHFITWGSTACERLHGHSYRVAAEVAGPLDRHQCVADFAAVHGACGRSSPSWTIACSCRLSTAPCGCPSALRRSRSRWPVAAGSFPATIVCCCRLQTRPRSFWPSTSADGCGSGWRRRAFGGGGADRNRRGDRGRGHLRVAGGKPGKAIVEYREMNPPVHPSPELLGNSLLGWRRTGAAAAAGGNRPAAPRARSGLRPRHRRRGVGRSLRRQCRGVRLPPGRPGWTCRTSFPTRPE